MADSRKKEKWIAVDIVFVCAVIFMFAGIVICTLATKGYRPYDGESLKDYSKGWETADGREASLDRISSLGNGKGNMVVLKNTLPDLDSDTDLNFKSKSILFTVYIDDKEVYDFHPDINNSTSRSYGNTFHYIHIPKAAGGCTIKIEAVPIYNDNSSSFGLIKLGNSGDYYQWFMEKHMYSALISLNILGFGILLIILAAICRKEYQICFNLVTLGGMALLSGIWSFIQTLVPQMMTHDMSLWAGLNYQMTLMIPYPTMCFVSSLFEKPKRKYDKMVFGISMSAMFICILLDSMRILDYHETLPIAHGAAIIELIVGIIAVVDDTKSIEGPVKKDPVLRISFCVFLASVLIDMARYALSGRGVDDAGYFMRIGLWLFILIMFYRSMKGLVEYLMLAAQTKAVSRIAYTDVLTGIPNRAAFVEKEAELQKQLDNGKLKRLLVCQMDVNNLKKANDSYGHAYGDEFIKTASNAISTAFKNAGSCFRVGGDEFTVFVTEEPVEVNYEKAVKLMKKIESEYNCGPNMKTPINIAYGAAAALPNISGAIEKAESDADDNMYIMKRASKVM